MYLLIFNQYKKNHLFHKTPIKFQTRPGFIIFLGAPPKEFGGATLRSSPPAGGSAPASAFAASPAREPDLPPFGRAYFASLAQSMFIFPAIFK